MPFHIFCDRTLFLAIPFYLVKINSIFLVKYLAFEKLRLFIYILSTFSLAAILTSIALYLLKRKKKDSRANNTIKLPKRKILKRQVALGIIGEDDFSIDEKKLLKPLWVYLGQKGLRGNIAMIGGIGKGKTASLIIPLLRQILLGFEDATIYIADVKGSLIGKVDPILEKSGRQVLRFCEGSEFRFNPIYRKDLLIDGNYEKIASTIKYASQNILGSDSKSKFWEKRAYDLTIAALISCHISKDYYTINDLRSEMVALNEEKLESLKEELIYKKFNEEELHNAQMALISIEEYILMGKEMKTSILASATVFLDLFNDFRIAKIFCPKKEEINLETFEDIVTGNNVIMTSFRSLDISRGLGTFLKILYTQAVKTTFLNQGDKKKDYFFFADEYQEIVTASDADITAVGREFGLVHLISFQSMSQLISRLKDKNIAEELLNNFQNQICFQVTDSATINHVISVAGKYKDKKVSEGFSENTQKANKNWLDGSYTSDAININQSYTNSSEDRDHLQKKDITRLRSFESFAFLTDGINSKFYKLFTKPDFLSENMAHEQVLKEVGESVCLPQL